MRTFRFALICTTLLFSQSIFAQQGMGVGNNNPQEMLDVSGALKIGTDFVNTNAAPTGGAGTIRWNGTNFQGWDGTQWITFSGSSAAGWELLGNAGTNPATNFIGTSDNQSLRLRTNNIERISVMGTGTAINARVGIGTNTVSIIPVGQSGLEIAGNVPQLVLNDLTGGAQDDFKIINGGGYVGLMNATTNTTIMALGMVNNSNNVGIGTTAPNDRLHVVGNIRMEDGNQAVGYVPVSDANGTMTWTDPTTLATSNDGDWLVNGTHIYKGNTGNVGIGTTTPSTPLEVINASGNSISTNHGIHAAGTGVTTGFTFNSVRMYQDSDNSVKWTKFGSPSIGFTYDQNGNLGIGTETPDRSLHIQDGEIEISHSSSAPSIYFQDDTDNSFMSINYQRSFDRMEFRNQSNAPQITIRNTNGYVGIGLGSGAGGNPSERLHVNGSIRMVDGNQAVGYIPVSDANGTMTWTDPSAISGLNELVDADGDTKVQVEEGTDDDIIRFDVDGVQAGQIAEDVGEIEILAGFNQPDGLLKMEEYGLLLKGNGTNGGQVLTLEGQLPGSIYPYGRVDFRNTDNSLYTGASIRSHNDGSVNDGDLRFMTANNQVLSEVARMTSTGFLGVGTATPATALHVAPTTNAGPTATFESGVNQYPGAAVSITPSGHATSERASVQIDDWHLLQDRVGNGTKDFSLWQQSSGSHRLTVSANGNVGIGDPTPKWPATVASTNALFSATDVIDPDLYALTVTRPDGTNDQGIGIGLGGSNSGLHAGAGIAFKKTGNNSLGDLMLTVKANGTSFGDHFPALTIKSISGNTGIGTTDPQEKLHVDGSVRMVDGNEAVGFIPVSDANGTMTWTDPAGVITGDAWGLQGNAGTTPGTDFIGTTDAQDFRLKTNSVERMAVLGTGTVLNARVGIGTTTASEVAVGQSGLEIAGNVPQLVLNDLTGGSQDDLRIINGGGVANFENATTNSTIMTIGLANSSNNVGIGVTAPDERLHVAGSVRMVDGNEAVGFIPVSDANGTMTWTDPATISAAAPFEVTANVVRSNTTLVTNSTDDFVFGSPQLDDDGDTGHDKRLLFDKSNGAFRAGWVTSSDWDDTNRGLASVAFGRDSRAGGDYSFAVGYGSTSTDQHAIAMGFGANASGFGSVSLGRLASAGGDHSFAAGFQTSSSGGHSLAFGRITTASGFNSTALGSGTTALSAFEMAVGQYNTSYTPNNTLNWDSADRLFVVGNGTSSANRNDALVILKNGNTGIGVSLPQDELHVDGSIRMVDGNQAAGFIPVSDANGTMTWTDPANVSDGDWTVTGNNQYSAVTGNVGIGTTVPTTKLDVEGDIHVNANGLLFTDTQNGNATVELRASDPSYPDEGVTLRTLTNPANGEPIFRVMSSGGAERLRVEHNGAVSIDNTIQIQGGNPGADKVLTATNGNGDAVWTDRGSFMAYNEQNGTFNHNNSDGWSNVTSPFFISVTNGDILELKGQASVRLTGGSGTDDFDFRVNYTGCASGNSNLINFRPDEGGSEHDNYTPIPYQDIMIAPCTGTLTFAFQIRNTGDDAWQAQDRIMVVRKN